jgi:hypothetical protein
MDWLEQMGMSEEEGGKIVGHQSSLQIACHSDDDTECGEVRRSVIIVGGRPYGVTEVGVGRTYRDTIDAAMRRM